MMARRSALSIALFVVPAVRGHGAVTHPKPRQAIDLTVAPWNGTVPDPVPFTNPNWCVARVALERRL
jgi:hypothetical protein